MRGRVNAIRTFTAGQTITAGQEFHTSANVSVVTGLNEKWKAETLSGLSKNVYYCHAQGNPMKGKDTNVGLNTLPDNGCYYQLKSYVSGSVILKMALKINSGSTKQLFVVQSDGTNTSSVSSIAINYDGTDYNFNNITGGYVEIAGNGSWITCDVTISVELYIKYYLFIRSTLYPASARYRFFADKKEIPTYTPYVHQH